MRTQTGGGSTRRCFHKMHPAISSVSISLSAFWLIRSNCVCMCMQVCVCLGAFVLLPQEQSSSVTPLTELQQLSSFHTPTLCQLMWTLEQFQLSTDREIILVCAARRRAEKHFVNCSCFDRFLLTNGKPTPNKTSNVNKFGVKIKSSFKKK